MKETRISPRDYALVESMILSQLSFPLWDEIKTDLPKGYIITKQDIGLLVRLNNQLSLLGITHTMQNILNWFNSLDELENHVLYSTVHCDPYELFIDA